MPGPLPALLHQNGPQGPQPAGPPGLSPFAGVGDRPAAPLYLTRWAPQIQSHALRGRDCRGHCVPGAGAAPAGQEGRRLRGTSPPPPQVLGDRERLCGTPAPQLCSFGEGTIACQGHPSGPQLLPADMKT